MMSTVSQFNTSNSSSQTTDCTPEVQHVSLAVFITLVFVVGFCLNGFSLWVFCCRMPRWNSGTVLQFHLALSDALATPATIMAAVYFANDSSWPFGRFLCQVKIGLLSAHFYGSTLFLMLISIHRYVAVVHFNRSSLMKQKTFVKKVCVGIWIFLLAKGIIYGYLLPSTTEKSRHVQCLTIHQKQLVDSYFVINFILFIVGFLLPFSVSAACYGLLASSVSQINPSTAHGPAVKSKSLRMIAVCLLIFGLCFLPLNVTRTIGVVVKRFYPDSCDVLRQVETAYYVSWILGGVNCCLDPLIYFFGSNNFRRTIWKSLKISREEKRSESETISQTGRRVVMNDVT
ncbi:P2Y purinoceptor 4 [Sardina pilchardus]|uniref:P2Y purinoceptor 4 n=1 Tax=Sardina pilchardus TaxID=27697 RepID=UPI002E1033B0